MLEVISIDLLAGILFRAVNFKRQIYKVPILIF